MPDELTAGAKEHTVTVWPNERSTHAAPSITFSLVLEIVTLPFLA